MAVSQSLMRTHAADAILTSQLRDRANLANADARRRSECYRPFGQQCDLCGVAFDHTRFAIDTQILVPGNAVTCGGYVCSACFYATGGFAHGWFTIFLVRRDARWVPLRLRRIQKTR
jgi:hypothetical protein